MRRRIVLITGVVVLAALSVPHTAAAKANAETFRGTCQIRNLVVTDPPLTVTPVDSEVTVTGHGTCTGLLTGTNGRVTMLDGAPAKMYAKGTGLAGCTAAAVSGRGAWVFGRERISFTYDELRGPTGPVTLHGVAGGEAFGVPTLSEGQDPAALAAACAGEGLPEVYVDVPFSTAGISG